jgi:Protein of unknown function (DUF2793)
MPHTQTARHQLPYLAVGQAQKEITHNEALTLIDALICPSVQQELDVPPSSLTETDTGKCWLIGVAAQDAWLSKTDQIACWTGGSWRYLVPSEGMRIWNLATGSQMIRRAAMWQGTLAIPDPSGGTNADIEARTAISAILQILRQNGSLFML